MSNKSKNKKKGNEPMATDDKTLITDVENPEIDDTTSEGDMDTSEKGDIADITAPIVDVNLTAENVTDLAPEVIKEKVFNAPEGADDETCHLYEMFNDYIDNVMLGGGVNRTQENVIKFVRIGSFISMKNKKKFIEAFFKEIILGPVNYLVAPELVFQFINTINDENKKKIEVLYTSLLMLKEHLERPKKSGIALDLKRVTEEFGSEALSEFIKSRI